MRKGCRLKETQLHKMTVKSRPEVFGAGFFVGNAQSEAAGGYVRICRRVIDLAWAAMYNKVIGTQGPASAEAMQKKAKKDIFVIYLKHGQIFLRKRKNSFFQYSIFQMMKLKK